MCSLAAQAVVWLHRPPSATSMPLGRSLRMGRTAALAAVPVGLSHQSGSEAASRPLLRLHSSAPPAPALWYGAAVVAGVELAVRAVPEAHAAAAIVSAPNSRQWGRCGQCRALPWRQTIACPAAHSTTPRCASGSSSKAATKKSRGHSTRAITITCRRAEQQELLEARGAAAVVAAGEASSRSAAAWMAAAAASHEVVISTLVKYNLARLVVIVSVAADL